MFAKNSTAFSLSIVQQITVTIVEQRNTFCLREKETWNRQPGRPKNNALYDVDKLGKLLQTNDVTCVFLLLYGPVRAQSTINSPIRPQVKCLMMRVDVCVCVHLLKTLN